MPDPNYVSEIEREDGTLLTIKDAEARAAIDNINPTLQQILSGVNDIKNGIGDTKSIIDAILSGEAPVPQVRFLDYDGAVVKTYTAKEFATLTELPDNPTHTGLTSQGWNWSLADAKTYVAKYGSLNIGQMYITSDGKTRIYISLPEGRTSPILQLYLNGNSELDIDWGDGSEHSTFTSTSANYKNERHEYPASGDYVIGITVVSGGFVLQSSSTVVSSILWNGNNNIISPDRAYNNSIKKIEIGDSVTSIGSNAFHGCYSLSSVTIPDSVTSIGSKAFFYCSSLSSVTIPNGVTSISDSAFQNCYSLSSVTIPDRVTSIGNSAFYYCYSLSSVTIPDSVTSIDSNAFSYCYSLSSITIPDSVTSIGSGAFSICYSLSSVTIPDSVTSIGSNAFQNCYSLSSITIPDSVTSIGSGAFSACPSLSSVTIPDSVTSIGNAFSYCDSLSSVTIPDSVTSIGYSAFYNCYSLSSVTIPDSVTSIGNSAFYSCYSLSSVTIPDSVTSIDSKAFYYCYSLSSVTIPDSVTSIDSNAFYGCFSLSSVTIPDSVTSIGNSAFSDCHSLSSITIPDSVTSIGSKLSRIVLICHISNLSQRHHQPYQAQMFGVVYQHQQRYSFLLAHWKLTKLLLTIQIHRHTHMKNIKGGNQNDYS
jgi:hypothetical protein